MCRGRRRAWSIENGANVWTGTVIPFALLALVVVSLAVFVVLQRNVRVQLPVRARPALEPSREADERRASTKPLRRRG